MQSSIKMTFYDVLQDKDLYHDVVKDVVTCHNLVKSK